MERAGLKPGLYNSEARNAGRDAGGTNRFFETKTKLGSFRTQ